MKIKFILIPWLIINACNNNNITQPVQTEATNINPSVISISPEISNIFKDIKSNFKLLCTSSGNDRLLVLQTTNKVFLLSITSDLRIELRKEFEIEKFEKLFEINEKIWIYNGLTKMIYKPISLLNSIHQYCDSGKINCPDSSKKIYNVNPDLTKVLNYGSSFTFLFNYGIYQQLNINYLDSCSLTKCSEGRRYFIAKYPSKYTKSFLSDRQTFFDIDSVGNIYTTYAYANIICKFSSNGELLNEIYFKTDFAFTKYVENDLTNLEYLRKYISQNEKNLSISFISDAKVVILRKKRQNQVIDPLDYEILISDLKRKTVKSCPIKQRVSQHFFAYKNNIYFITSDFENLLHYEFN